MLAADLRRAQQALAAAERAATAREAQLAAAAGEAASLGRAHHEAQVEIQQLLQDLQVGIRVPLSTFSNHSGTHHDLSLHRDRKGMSDGCSRISIAQMIERLPRQKKEQTVLRASLPQVSDDTQAACRQAYERQVDALGRALKRGEVDGQDLGQERHSLLQQLRAAEQVRHRDAGRACGQSLLAQPTAPTASLLMPAVQAS